MKNLALLLGVFTVLAFTSCKKCKQCSFQTSSNLTYTSERECGSKSDREDFQSAWEQRAMDSLTTAVCKEENN